MKWWWGSVAAAPVAAFLACAENPTAPPIEQLQPVDAALLDGETNGDGGEPETIACTATDFVEVPTPGAQIESFGATEDALYVSLANASGELDLRKYLVKAPCTLERDGTFTYVPKGHARVGGDGSLWEGGNELGRVNAGAFTACDVDPALLAADAGVETFLGPWALQATGAGGYAVYMTFAGNDLVGARFAQFTANGTGCHVAPLGDALATPKPYVAVAVDRGGRLWAMSDTATSMTGAIEIEVRDANTGALTTSNEPANPAYLAYDFADALTPCDDTVCLLDYEQELVTKLGADAKPLGSFAILSPEGKRFRPMAIASSSKGVFVAGNVNAAGAADDAPSAPMIVLGPTPK